MKQIFTSLLLLISFGLFAQPANDDCEGIVDLGIAPSCDSTLYNNVGATESNIGFDNFPNCFVGVPDRDVWFSFVASDTILDYRVEVIGCPDPNLGLASMVNPQIAVYRGDCEFDGLQLLDCVSAVPGETSVFVDLIGLTPGITYFLRINDWSSSGTPNEGAFKLCVTKKPPVNTVDQGGSTECSGILTDSGGETGDYGNDENSIFTICPTDPHGCILFEFQYYNVEFNTDAITLYDGPDTSSPQLAQLSGAGTFAENYGGVCYAVSASSGCITVQFQSDSNVSFEGFLATWQCIPEACSELEIPEMIVDANASPDDIVSSVISGQTLISVVNVDCAQGQVGTFTITDDSPLSMDKGLVLSSGSVENIPAPASDFSAAFYGGINQTDDDLNYLSTINGNGSQSQDACIVELDVLAASEELTFEYVFGSEEYPEYVNTTFNDIFAFLVSGPEIAGDPNIDNQLNVATLEDGTFIQINSVNHNQNWQFYRNNEQSQSIVYDGLTSDSLGIKKSLTARVPTIPCETYKLKFAIADRGDSSFDSGVFISKINSGTPEVGVNYQSGIDYLVEECVDDPDEVIISFGNPLTSPQTYNIVLAGNAEHGVDYELDIPSTITFETGTEIFTFPILALADGVIEGTDTIEIQLVRDFGCGSVVVSSISILIFDNVNVEILDNALDTAIICATAGCIPLEVGGAHTYSWQADTLFSDPTIANPIVCTTTSQWVTVEGTLGICHDIDSIYLNVIDLELDILPDETAIQVCSGETVTLLAQNNANDVGITWSSFSALPDPSNPLQVISDPGFGVDFLNVSLEIGGCTVTDNINITWVPFDLPSLVADTVICQNYSVDLGEDITSNSTTYEWSPDLYLSPSADVSGPIATPEVTTTYTLISTAGQGANVCADTSTVTIEVIPVDIEILNPDTTFVCIGDSVTLNSINTTGGVGVTWMPNEFLDEVSPEEVIVYPPVSNWYYNVLETANCLVIDSVYVRVDSLPDLSIIADPEKDSYCQGDEVYLLSPTYEPAHFPGIDLTWEQPIPGAQTPDSFLNLVILAVETFTYVRTTTVGACVSVDSIEIEVVPVADISVVPSLDTLCQGESIQLSVEGPPGLSDFTWSPGDGLSCTECPDPVATPQGTTTYQVELEFDGCPAGASTTLVVPAQVFQFPGPDFICAGQSVQLNSLNVPGAVYSWTSSDGSLTSSDPQPIVTPAQTTTYSLSASIADCTFETEITIVVSQDFTISIDPVDAACPFNDPTVLNVNANPSIGNYTFNWTNNINSNTPTGQTITVGPPITAIFTVEVNDGCFTHTESIEVEVAPDYSITATPPVATALQGQPVTFMAEATVAGIDFVWTDANGNIVGNGEILNIESCEDETYLVTGSDFNGCTQTATVQLDVDAFTVLVNPVADTVLAGEQTTFTASADVDGLTYEWVGSDGTTGSGPTFTASSCTDQTYTVTGTDDNGCSDSAIAGLFVLDGFAVDSMEIVEVTVDTLEGIYEGQEIELFAYTTPELFGATYVWLLNGDTLAVTNQPASGSIFLPEVAGDISATYTVVVTSSDGCDQSLSLESELLDNPVEMPNVFTPNGDSVNDVLTLVSLVPVDILEFRVWNRWGKLVFENQDGSDGWDGMIDDNAAASDVYIFSIVYQIPGSGNPMPAIRGDVTLVR